MSEFTREQVEAHNTRVELEAQKARERYQELLRHPEAVKSLEEAFRIREAVRAAGMTKAPKETNLDGAIARVDKMPSKSEQWSEVNPVSRFPCADVAIGSLLEPKTGHDSGTPPTEAQKRWQKGEEKRIHEEFEKWLRLNRDELYFDHSRMDRATTNRVGAPDFVIQHAGQVLNIEIKTPTGKLSEKQKDIHAWIERTGGIVHVIRSTAGAIALVKETFSI